MSTYRFVPEVEALRGIAALSVVFEHTVSDTGGFSRVFHIIFNGRAAVLLFFVMSGFALATQVRDQRLSPWSYAAFVVRRLFRLMPVIWLALALSYIVIHLRRGHNELQYDDLEVIGNALLFRFLLNPPYWTLYVELWCSVAFPLLFWLWNRVSVLGRCLMTLSLLAPSFLLPLEPIRYLPLEWSRYLVCFCLGLAAAEYRGFLKDASNTTLILLAWATVILGGSVNFWSATVSVVLIVSSVSYCVLLAIILLASDRQEQTPLQWRSARFLGTISFIIYAFHSPIAWAVMAGVSHNVSLKNFELAWFITTSAVTIVVSYYVFRFFERPLNDLGKLLSKRIFHGAATTRMA